MAGEQVQITRPYPNAGTHPQEGGQKAPPKYRLNPTTGQWEEDTGDSPPSGRWGTTLPDWVLKGPAGFDPNTPPEQTVDEYEQATLAGIPQFTKDAQGNTIPLMRVKGQKTNPAYTAWQQASLDIYNRGIAYLNATGQHDAAIQMEQERNKAALALQGQKAQDESRLSQQQFGQNAALNQQEYGFKSALQSGQQTFQAQQQGAQNAFDWSKMLSGQDFQKSMQVAQFGFQQQMQQAQDTWQTMENDKNRAIENRRVAIEQGHLDEAVRHNRVTENLQMQQQIQQSKIENLNMIQGILKDPAVFMMMRRGGFSFAQVAPEYGSLDTIPVPSENTPQNLARWQAGSQFAKQEYLPGMAPGMPQLGAQGGQGSPIPQQLTLGQVLPGVTGQNASLPAWSPSPWNPQGGPQGSNTQPKGSEALY